MTSKHRQLMLGFVTLCVLPAAAVAQVTLLSENFDSLATTMAGFSGPVGPDFMGTNVQISGGPTGVCNAPASGNCLVLQNALGVLTSKMVTLDPGIRYVLSFDLVGNSLTGNTTSSVATVTLGSLFDHTYTLTNGSPIASTEVTQALTVSMPETLDLTFAGTGSVSRTAGMVVDNILLTGTPTPEPATLGLMVLGLLGAAGFAKRKRQT
jgi:hypothetical protein